MFTLAGFCNDHPWLYLGMPWLRKHTKNSENKNIFLLNFLENMAFFFQSPKHIFSLYSLSLSLFPFITTYFFQLPLLFIFHSVHLLFNNSSLKSCFYKRKFGDFKSTQRISGVRGQKGTERATIFLLTTKTSMSII